MHALSVLFAATVRTLLLSLLFSYAMPSQNIIKRTCKLFCVVALNRWTDRIVSSSAGNIRITGGSGQLLGSDIMRRFLLVLTYMRVLSIILDTLGYEDDSRNRGENANTKTPMQSTRNDKVKNKRIINVIKCIGMGV